MSAFASLKYLNTQPDSRHKLMKLAVQALKDVGLSVSPTAREAIDTLCRENTISGFKPNDFDDSDNLYNLTNLHDLGHIFCNAVGGDFAHEEPALKMESLLFGNTSFASSHGHSHHSMERRAHIIKSLYLSIFGEYLDKDSQWDDLADIPVGVFGLEAHHKSDLGRTEYYMMPAAPRKKFLDRFKDLAASEGISIQYHPDAILDAPASLIEVDRIKRAPQAL